MIAPFPDQWFTSYVANLVLHLVEDPRAMISEAYRVLRPNSIAAFTVNGRKENCLLLTIIDIAKERLAARKSGCKPPSCRPSAVTPNFDFSENIAENV